MSGVSRPGPVRLVLVHGTRFSSAQWAGYAELIPGADVVAVDLPGDGVRVDEPFTWDAALAVVGDAVASAAPGVPVVIAGHSLGGYVAAGYAHEHPDALAGLVLVGASADPARHPALRRVYAGFAGLLPRVGAARMAGVTNRVMRRLGANADQLPGHEAYASVPDAWAAVMARCGVHQVAGLGCPVTIVNGQFDQMRVDANAYAAASGARVVTIPRATHLLPLTHRDELAAVLREVTGGVRP